MTKGDNIRRMLATDEGIADFFMEHGIDDGIDFCHSENKPECEKLVNIQGGGSVPDEWCRQCLTEWLKKESFKDSLQIKSQAEICEL